MLFDKISFMSRKKLKKFEQAKKLPNIFLKDRLEDKEKLKKILEKQNKIFLELAAGRGEYTLYLAEKNPEAFCLAVDFRSNRLLWGAKKALERNLPNALFLRERVEELPNYFEPHSVDKIWLPFPDPFPKERHEKHRLTNQLYLKIYKNLLKKDSPIYFKTDNQKLFEYTLENLKLTKAKIILISKDLLNDFKNRENEPEHEEILLPTKYQTQAIKEKRKIYFVKFLP